MSRYIATETFVDPTDGLQVTAGRTVVAAEADVYRAFPSRFKRSIGEFPALEITRVGGTAELTKGGVTPARRPRHKPASREPKPPTWLLAADDAIWRL